MGEKLENLPPHIRDAVLAQMGQENLGKVRKRTDPAELEGSVQADCLKLLGVMNICAWRQNTGGAYFKGRYVPFGRPGQADITGLLPGGRRLDIETKRRKGGKQSDDQIAFQADMEAQGGLYLLVRSAGELHEKLTEAMAGAS